MFRSLQDFFDSLAAPSTQRTSPARAHGLHLAAAVLLVEVMRAEPTVSRAESDAVRAALARRYGLDGQELESLMQLAEAESARANDFFHFTSRLNELCSQPEKVELVEAMWQVAYSDGMLDAGENHVISKVAGLLHVTHGEYIAAKMRARDAAGLA
jgi:uncharacterized tellurite resistance protein B-like protein